MGNEVLEVRGMLMCRSRVLIYASWGGLIVGMINIEKDFNLQKLRAAVTDNLPYKIHSVISRNLMFSSILYFITQFSWLD